MSWGVVAGSVIAGGAVIAGASSDRKNANNAMDAQERQNSKSDAFIRQQANLARADAIPLFNTAQNNRQIGAQQATNLLGLFAPQQARLFQEGNVGAQNRLGQGLEQTRNALFGLPTDLSFAQNAQQLNVPNQLFNQQLPQFERPDLSRPAPPTETEADPFGRLTQGAIGAATRRRGGF